VSKRILVTGGAGFIGSAVVAQLLEQGHELVVADNLSFGRRELARVDDSRFFNLDIRDQAALTSLVGRIQPHWVIHLAAIHYIPYCNEHPFEAFDINVRGTMNVLDAAAGSRSLERLFFASTAAVYPIHDGAVAESHAVGPIDVYGLSKLVGERLVQDFHGRTRLPAIACRFFNAFGPNETNPHLIPEIQQQLKSGARTIRLGNLTPKRDFIHTSDMARAVTALMTMRLDGFDTFNLGRGIEYSVTEIVEAFERQLGEPIRVEQDPARVRRVERMHLLADVGKLKRATGWEPVEDLDGGIKSLLD
jgi:UDP-glucose 4-epimerase